MQGVDHFKKLKFDVNIITKRKSVLLFHVKNRGCWCLRTYFQDRCSNKRMKKIKKEELCRLCTWPNIGQAGG